MRARININLYTREFAAAAILFTLAPIPMPASDTASDVVWADSLRHVRIIPNSGSLISPAGAGLLASGADARLLVSDSRGLADAGTDLNVLIDGLQRKYSRMQGIAADFTQTYQGADGRVLKESGRVVLKRPRKARWDYAAPERKLFVSDGREIYFYVYGEKEATRTTIKESVDPQIPFLFLLGQGNLRRDFTRIEVEAGVQPAALGDVVLKLVPKRAPEDFRELLAEANPVSFEVRRLVIFGRNGSRMDFLLSNIRENYVVPDAEFTFTPPPGVIVRRVRS